MKIIRGRQPGAKKVVIYGPEGIGKSTFASKFPDPVFIDTEGSTKDMDVARTEAPTSWTMLMEQVKYIKTYPDTCRTLVVDTIDWAERLCIDHICAQHQKKGVEDFGYGKGYVYVKEEFGRFLDRLSEVTDAGVNVVLTAHTQIKKFEQPDEMGSYDRWELKLGQKTASQTAPLVKEWADMVLFANYKIRSIATDDKGQKRKAQGGKRVMYTSHHPCWDAKNRYGLPEEMDFDYAGIAPIIGGGEPAVTSPPQHRAAQEAPAQASPPQEQGRQEQMPPESSQTSEGTGDTQPRTDAGQQVAQEPPKGNNGKPAPEDDKDSMLHLDERIPKKLRDLMIANTVFEEEIQAICEAKGFVTMGTRLWDYDKQNPGIVDGLLIAEWDSLFKKIQETREAQELPFD